MQICVYNQIFIYLNEMLKKYLFYTIIGLAKLGDLAKCKKEY